VVPVLVTLLLALGVPVAPAATAQGATSPGTREQALRIAVRDGPGRTQPQSLDATLYLPARTPAPAVLLAHGFGQTKDSVADEARSLAARGYVVLAWSATGFGASTGQIALDDPNHEVADASQLVDWLATRPEVRLDGPGDPRVGVTGGSYGGALSLLLAAYDHRVDATVPLITWNDLGQALFPNDGSAAPVTSGTPAPGADGADGVFKRSWASLFFGIGQRSPGSSGPAAPDVCGRFAPEVCAGYVEAVRTGREPPALAAYLARVSPASVASRITAPTLLVQGENDTLFGLDQADATARQIAAGGGTVAVAWFNGGHDGGSPDQRTNARISGWLDHYLQGVGSAPPTAFTYVLPSGVRSRATPTQRLVTVPAYPGLPGAAPGPRESLALAGGAQTVVSPAGGVPGSISSIPGLTALAGGTTSGASGSGGSGGSGSSGSAGGTSALLGRLASDLPGQAATFTTDPLAARTVVSGSPQVRVTVAAPPAAARPGVTSPATSPVLFGKVYDVAPGQNGAPPTRVLLGSAVAPVRLPVLPADGSAVPVTVTLPGVVATVQAGHRLEVALATTDQGFASPPDPAVYRVDLDRSVPAVLSVPEVTGTETGGTSVPLGPVVAIGLLLVGVVVAVLVGRVVAAHRRRRDLEPGGDLAVDADLVDVPLVVSDLGKTYRNGFVAVRDVGFRVERGQVLGLLGPNGAGKTTTLRMLMGLVRPTAGELRVFGVRVVPGAPVLERVGSFVEGPGFLPHLSGRSNLELYWAATGRPLPEARMDEALEIAGLGTAIDRVVKTYSHGMRQRLAIAQAMLGLPDLLVLDEPTNGLDPPQIHAMRDVLRRYAGESPEGGRRRTVLVSSHLLAEVEQTCSHVVVMHRGEVVATGEVAELVAGGQLAITVPASERDRAVAIVAAGEHAAEADRERDDVVVVDVGREAGPTEHAAVVRTLVDAGIDVVGVGPRRRLEDAFLALIGEEGGPS
jgi:ABC-2 type transport system ATP-binding protein